MDIGSGIYRCSDTCWRRAAMSPVVVAVRTSWEMRLTRLRKELS